jgi:hypothetical protein
MRRENLAPIPSPGQDFRSIRSDPLFHRPGRPPHGNFTDRKQRLLPRVRIFREQTRTAEATRILQPWHPSVRVSGAFLISDRPTPTMAVRLVDGVRVAHAE